MRALLQKKRLGVLHEHYTTPIEAQNNNAKSQMYVKDGSQMNEILQFDEDNSELQAQPGMNACPRAMEMKVRKYGSERSSR